MKLSETIETARFYLRDVPDPFTSYHRRLSSLYRSDPVCKLGLPCKTIARLHAVPAWQWPHLYIVDIILSFQVVGFVRKLADILEDYEIACEHEHSNCVLIAHKKV